MSYLNQIFFVQIGVPPTGPYWQRITGTPQERLAHGVAVFHQQFGASASPDVVVFSSKLWDLHRIGGTAQDNFVGQSIDADELAAYGLHLGSILDQIEVRSQDIFIFVPH